VLRSHHARLRILLAIAMIAVVGLSVAVVIRAGDDGNGTTATPAVGSPAARVAESSSSLCTRRNLRTCTPPRGAPGAQLRLAPKPAGRRYDGGTETAHAASSPR
jgi:hypothetical protein